MDFKGAPTFIVFQTACIQTDSEVPLSDDPRLKILWAAENGNDALVTELLTADASLAHATDSDGYTPLHRASYEGHKTTIKVSAFRVKQVYRSMTRYWCMYFV